MSSWAGLNERHQQFINKDNYRELQAIYETDQEQEADERGMWKRGGRPRAATDWQCAASGTTFNCSLLLMRVTLNVTRRTRGKWNEAVIKCNVAL